MGASLRGAPIGIGGGAAPAVETSPGAPMSIGGLTVGTAPIAPGAFNGVAAPPGMGAVAPEFGAACAEATEACVAWARRVGLELAPALSSSALKQPAKAATQHAARAIAKRRWDGRAVKTFASDHAISSANAGVRVFRARGALRRGVLAVCGESAEGGCLDCTCEHPADGRESSCHGA